MLGTTFLEIILIQSRIAVLKNLIALETIIVLEVQRAVGESAVLETIEYVDLVIRTLSQVYLTLQKTLNQKTTMDWAHLAVPALQTVLNATKHASHTRARGPLGRT